jgi:Fe-S-cluster containining protein
MDGITGGNGHSSKCRIIDFALDFFEKPISFRIGIEKENAGLADIVPLAKTISSRLSDALLEELRADGISIPCKKGCAACCSYLIPLSVPEVFRLRDEIAQMPSEESRRITEALLVNAKKILDNSRTGVEKNSSAKTNLNIQAARLSRWYSSLKMSCPFLSNDLCITYDQRPVACREHVVTTAAKLCQEKWSDQALSVAMPVRITDVLSQLSAELESSSPEAIMLPLALPWAENNLTRGQRQWPAIEMVERLFEIVRTKLALSSALTAISA